MAGFLAPTLSDIAPAPIAPAPRADTSIGDAFSGLGSLINLVGRGTGGTTATETQQDRDDRILRPTFDSFRVLLAQRDSGDLTPSRFEALKTGLISSAIAANPSQRVDIVEGLSVLAGEPVGVVEESVAGIDRTNRNEWLTTVIGSTIASIAVGNSIDEEGNLDAEALDLAVDTAYRAFLLDAADAKQIELSVNKAKLRLDYDNIKEAEWISPLLSAQTKTAGEAIHSSISAFLNDTSGRSDDAISALVGLEAQKGHWINIFTLQAGDRGILDEASYKAGLGLIEQQFDTQISFLQEVVDSEAALTTVMQNRSDRAMITVLTNAGIPATEESIKLYSIILMEKNVKEIGSLAMATTPPVITSPTFVPTASEPGSPTVYTEEFSREAATLTEELQIHDVTVGIEYWKGGRHFPDKNMKDVDQRGGLVTKLGQALGVLNVTGDPISESTFDKVYDPDFINQYRRITKFDDETARTLENVVKLNLMTTLDKRRTFTETNIENRLGSDFPGVVMRFDGEKFIINYGSGRATSVPQLKLFGIFDRHGVPRTSEGVTTLLEGTQELSRDEIRDLRVVQGVSDDEISYLNKIVGTINMFPEFSEESLPGSSLLNLVEAPTVHKITTPEDVTALQKGDAWEFIDEDGTVHRGVV